MRLYRVALMLLLLPLSVFPLPAVKKIPAGAGTSYHTLLRVLVLLVVLLQARLAHHLGDEIVLLLFDAGAYFQARVARDLRLGTSQQLLHRAALVVLDERLAQQRDLGIPLVQAAL